MRYKDGFEMKYQVTFPTLSEPFYFIKVIRKAAIVAAFLKRRIFYLLAYLILPPPMKKPNFKLR